MAKTEKKQMQTLDECVREQGTDLTLYIGGSEAFFWIGTAEQYEVEIDAVDRYMIDSMKERLSQKRETIKNLKKQIKTLEQNIKGWKPLRERKVKDTYSSIDPDESGPRILIDGITTGRGFWFKHEYEAVREAVYGKK